VGAALPAWNNVPLATLTVNVVGAFLLGALLQSLASPSVDAEHGRRLRLFAGTGVLGGFTTYSALATETLTLLPDHPGTVVGYALATVVLGGVASAAGITLARRPPTGRRPRAQE
jgi:CrcB protein